MRQLAMAPVSAVELEQLRNERAELLRLLNEIRQQREQIGGRNVGRPDVAAQAGAPDPASSRLNEMRQLGLAASQGDAAALQKLSELSAAAAKTRTNVNQDTHGELRVAFAVMGEEAGKGSETAFQALWSATRMKDLKGMAIMALGQAAGMGNERALEPLLDPDRYLLLPSTATSALKFAAENGNTRAIEALAAVGSDPKRKAMWYQIAENLQKPAAAGNATAIDALAQLGRAENKYVRQSALLGLEKAAANNQAKAADALRSLGYQ
jgi:hypothetical protein